MFFFSFSSPLSLALLYCHSLSVFRSKTRGDPSLRWCWRGSAARRGRKRRREKDRPLLQSSERRFFFPSSEEGAEAERSKGKISKASFGAHAHRRLCAPARLYLYRSSSPRVKGLAGSSARRRREQLSDGRERESARPEKTVSLFAPKARGEKKEPNFPHGRNAPRSPSLVLSCFSLSLSPPFWRTWACTRHRKLSNCWTEALQFGPSQSAETPASGCAEPPPPERCFLEEESSSPPEE